MLTTTLLAAIFTLAPAVSPDLPARPEEIEFGVLRFETPEASQFRHELSNGVPVYLAPSREFPLVNIALSFKGGDDLDPADAVGLARATAAMIRRGGTTTVSAADLDERFDYLAAIANVGAGKWATSANLNALSSNLDEATALFFDMLRHPAFDQSKLDIWKAETLERMRQRNDDAGPILDREWAALLYGRDHFEARQITRQSLDAITRARMEAFHARICHPGNVIVAVTGDFEVSDMLERLERLLGKGSGWAKGEPVPDPPPPQATFAPGTYHVEKEIPQGKVFIGMRGIARDDPDYFAALVMNDILGGGGFTSRITRRVRSDEGLAYSAGSRLAPEVWYPGEWRAGFQSKNETVALATKIVMEEIERIRTEPVSDEEIETSISQFVETFPRSFESKPAMLSIFVNDEWTRRPPGFWKNWRENVAKVTKEDVRRVAERMLQPDQIAIFVVGRWDEIYPGDRAGRASMSDFFDGNVEHLPLRDPLTQQPVN
ncbi:MAG TPA: pitrilysin family protein [Phycisphaerales bacterium]|nr:pitrilysin family protein [Phycisphaerales bacterium]HMP37541.1 pitrilysin family protein [Phycisphaerales bacterium]